MRSSMVGLTMTAVDMPRDTTDMDTEGMETITNIANMGMAVGV